MTIEDAKNIVNNFFKDTAVKRGFEFDNEFVFEVESTNPDVVYNARQWVTVNDKEEINYLDMSKLFNDESMFKKFGKAQQQAAIFFK